MRQDKKEILIEIRIGEENMKRYIRTENGKIFDTEFVPAIFKWDWNVKFIIDDNNLIIYDKRSKDRIANHGQILKQSDNLEELIDEFRNVTYGKNPEISNPLTYEQAKELKLKDAQRNEFSPSFQTFGVIWFIRDNGEPIMKSVAEMNEKGDIKLLLCEK